MSQDEQSYIDGTTIIRNLVGRDEQHPHGTRDAATLEKAEVFLASSRMLELLEAGGPADGVYSFTYMREVHRHLFQDVYAWAGTPRNVPMTKSGTDYATPREAQALLREQYGALRDRDFLRGISDRREFTRQIAAAWAEINHGHAFREGNTRSQSVFFTLLARDAGWDLDVSRLAPDHPISARHDFVSARFEHQALRQQGETLVERSSQALAETLISLIKPSPGPAAARLRGEPVAPPQRHLSPAQRRFPELRDEITHGDQPDLEGVDHPER